MGITRYSSGGPFEAKIGYSRAVAAGGWLFVSGCTGTDPATGELPGDVVGQCRNTLATIAKALAHHGASFSDVVRVTYMLPKAADFEPCWPLLREAFGDAPPAATMIECGLIGPQFLIEIEVTALLPSGH